MKQSPMEKSGFSAGAVASIIIAAGIALVIAGNVIRSNRGEVRPPSNYELIAAAKAEVRQRSKDPDSVQFGDVWVGRLVTESTSSGTPVVCGYFNAKNGFGGYFGQQRFFGGVGMLMFEEQHRVLIEHSWHNACVQIK